ncbi:pyridoxal phosphate-dependent aminotransferase [Methanosarcinales archaeon]|nr:MAG: pyridoxal phosphate-dependent aminotransferase [Methanosarcinales archaeon]
MHSDRVRDVDISGIRKMFECAGEDAINLGLGEPDFDTPSHIKEAAIRALNEGHTHYTPSMGIPELREAICEKLRRENGIDAEPSEVIVTPGAKHAIFEAVTTLVDEGDEVILIGPAWVTYEACVRYAGGKAVYVNTSPEEGYIPYDVGEYITPKTKLVILNSPCNPSGAVYPPEVIREIAELSIDHGFFVLSDEIYEKIIYEGEHLSAGSIAPERTITVNGFSKSYAMTGWRLGYAAAPQHIIKAMLKVQSHSVSHPTSFVQWAGVEALKGSQQCVEDMRKEFERRRDILMEGLRDIGIECPIPDGAFYVFVPTERAGGDDVAMRLLQEALVSVTPGSAFGKAYKNYIRISYAVSTDKLMEAIKRMEGML